jgi:hypothetical protein
MRQIYQVHLKEMPRTRILVELDRLPVVGDALVVRLAPGMLSEVEVTRVLPQEARTILAKRSRNATLFLEILARAFLQIREARPENRDQVAERLASTAFEALVSRQISVDHCERLQYVLRDAVDLCQACSESLS